MRPRFTANGVYWGIHFYGGTNVEEYCIQDDTFWVLVTSKVDHENLNLNRRCTKGLLQNQNEPSVNFATLPDKVVIDKSGANLAGLLWTNVMLKFTEVS